MIPTSAFDITIYDSCQRNDKFHKFTFPLSVTVSACLKSEAMRLAAHRLRNCSGVSGLPPICHCIYFTLFLQFLHQYFSDFSNFSVSFNVLFSFRPRRKTAAGRFPPTAAIYAFFLRLSRFATAIITGGSFRIFRYDVMRASSRLLSRLRAHSKSAASSRLPSSWPG